MRPEHTRSEDRSILLEVRPDDTVKDLPFRYRVLIEGIPVAIGRAWDVVDADRKAKMALDRFLAIDPRFRPN